MNDGFRKQLRSNFDQKTTDELIEIWKTNNRVDWSDAVFEVVREILLERLPELPAQNPPVTEAMVKEKEKLEKQKVGLKFHWLLPFLGALGFGIGFALTGAIMRSIYYEVWISVKHTFGEQVNPIWFGVSAWLGIISGGLGGSSLGWALKNKKLAIHLALAGAIGFGIAFLLILIPDLGWNLGWEIIHLMGGPVGSGYLDLEVELAHGLGMGTIVGALGGLALGLAVPRYRVISCLLLCIAGIFAFGNVFAFGYTIYDAHMNSPWNGMGGALGGAALGLALALHTLVSDGLQRRKGNHAKAMELS